MPYRSAARHEPPHDLGELLSAHPLARHLQVRMVAGVAALTSFIVLMIALHLAVEFTLEQAYPILRGTDIFHRASFQNAAGTVGAIWLFGTLVFIGERLVWLTSKPRVVLRYRRGLAVCEWFGVHRFIAFDGCHAHHWTGPHGSSRFSLRDRDGAALEIEPALLEWGHVLANAIRRGCVEPNYRRAIASYDAGEAVAFGPIVIDRKRLRIAGRWFERDELTPMIRAGVELIFHPRSDASTIEPIRIRWADVPDSDNLIALLRR